MSQIFDQSADSIFAGALAAQSQKSTLAQYAIQQAAKYMQNNNYDAAAKEFKKALAFDAANETAHTYLGKIYLTQNKTKDAIKEFKETARLQPLSVTALIDLGNAYIQDKNYVEAEKSLKHGARMDPLNPVPDYTLGHLYIQTDRLNEAEAQFKKAQRVSPRDGNVYYSLGMVYNKQGKYEEAVKNLEKSLTLKKNFPAANYELGVAYNGMGDTEKAQQQLSLLNSTDYTLAQDLKYVLDKPRIISMDTTKSGGFTELMGPRTPVWMLGITEAGMPLAAADASQVFSVTIQFNTEMDMGSVTSTTNWSITKANSTQAGFYNDLIPTTSREASVAPIPLSVTYNALDLTATVSFRISQNSTADATIDPSHLVFSYKGKDAAGRSMDEKANEIDGYALKAF